MQAKISFYVSEAAQRAIMASTDQPVSRDQKHTIEVGPEDLPYLNVKPNGLLEQDLDSFPGPGLRWDERKEAGVPEYATVDPYAAWSIFRSWVDGAKYRIAQLQARKEAAAAARTEATRVSDEKAAAWIDDLPRSTTGSYSMLLHAFRAVGVDDPDLTTAPLATAAQKRFNERCEASQKEKKEAEERRERDKLDYIAKWIEAHADEEIKQQFADGVLDKKEAIKMIADEALRPLGPAFDPKICSLRSCACGREDIASLPRSAYPGYRALKSAIPNNAEIQLVRVQECLRDDDGYAEGDEATEPAYAALVKVPAGPFTFERLVLLDEE